MPVIETSSLDYIFIQGRLLEADLVLVDLDDVILTPAQYICSSTWYAQYIRNTKSHINERIEDNSLLTTYFADILYNCFTATSFNAVDSNLINLLTSLSSKHLVIGLTGRTGLFSEQTGEWLTKLGMKFTESEVEFSNSTDSPIMSNGVIYVGHEIITGLPKDKGKALNEFIKLYPKPIEKIVLIDDIIRNHHHVERFAEEYNIEYLGIYYTKVYNSYFQKGFSLSDLDAIGNIQLFHWLEDQKQAILSDEEAFSIYNKDGLVCSINYLYQESVIINNTTAFFN
ncbi:hypothetical protein I862_02065 [endosymbiont of Acanthamoeba sp. UWC8]|uniref:DUF2608 domain-containing protein n=1 Tax=endosymbiont of Acanthamoeba sp. UWC8 TaxID=86106 RepID=UPI0004D167CD|nr:DUF2608 domain-containing protein [endosymbiont of Acanthamoeba sp. UWC8]AIF80976.1 hypothetical protein I862_02065 [endosymbiont of Acanthamoeba sp. UWC8]